MYQNTISEELTKQIRQICDDYGIRIYKSYSGRYMYGSTCFGLVFDGTAGQLFAAFLRYLDDDCVEEMADLFDEMKTDSMGYDTIYYFPGWTLDKVDSDEEEEEEED